MVIWKVKLKIEYTIFIEYSVENCRHHLRQTHASLILKDDRKPPWEGNIHTSFTIRSNVLMHTWLLLKKLAQFFHTEQEEADTF